MLCAVSGVLAHGVGHDKREVQGLAVISVLRYPDPFEARGTPSLSLATHYPIQHPIPNRLRQMRRFELLAGSQIRNRPCEF